MKKILTIFALVSFLLPQLGFATTKIRANAGPDRRVGINQETTIYATNSFLAGNRPEEINYSWELKSYPKGYEGENEKEGKGLEEFEFIPNVQGVYLVLLTLEDPSEDESVSDYVIITVKRFEEMFSDLPASHWARDHFFHLAMNGVIRGYPDGTVRPNETISRAEFLVMCFRALEISEGRSLDEIEINLNDIYFADVKRGDWFYKEILAAANYNVVEGYTNRTFQPHRDVNRAEALKIALHFTDIKVETNSIVLNQYRRYIDPTDWSARYVSTAYRKGLLGEDINAYLRTYEPMNRADAAALIDRIFFNPEQNYDLVSLDVFRKPRDY